MTRRWFKGAHRRLCCLLLGAMGFLCPTAFAAITLDLDGSTVASLCDTVILTNRMQNTGATIGSLRITNSIPAGMVYVTNVTVVTLPNGQVLNNAAAEPDQVIGGNTLVWDFSDVVSDSGLTTPLLTEVFYDPTNAVEDDYEWVEIYNPTASSIDLTGWKLVDVLPAQTDAIPSVVISPGEFVIVAANTSVFFQIHAGYTGKVVQVADLTIGSGLNNFADGVFLKNAAGTTVDAMSYGGSSAAFSPGASVVSDGQSLVRNPINADNNNANDWSAGNPPNPGSGSAQTGIGQNGILTIVYRVELGCGAASGIFRSGASFEQPPGSGAAYASDSLTLNVQSPAINVYKLPLEQSASYNDLVVWTVKVENVGFGQADNVVVVDSRGPGIQFVGFSHAPTNAAPYSNLTSVAWSGATVPALSTLDSGEIVSIIVTARVVACTGLYNNVSAQSGCQGLVAATNGTCITAAGNEGASIAFNYKYADLSSSITPSSLLALSYCGGSPVTITLTNQAGADVGYALGIQLEPVLPTGYTVTGAQYSAGLNRIVVGDLAPGAVTNVTVTLIPGGSCPLNKAVQQVTFKPSYEDPCGLDYATPPVSIYTSLTNEPAARLSATIPSSVSGTASSMTVQLFLTYTNFSNTSVTFMDQYPVDSRWRVTNVSANGSVVDPYVRWTTTLSGSGVYTGSYQIVWTNGCNLPSGYLAHTLYASNFTDCVGCSRGIDGTGVTYYTQVTLDSSCSTNGGEGGTNCTFSVTRPMPLAVEVCETVTVTARIHNLSGALTTTWANVVFSNDLSSGRALLASTNSVVVTIDGTDYTPNVTIAQTNRALVLTFNGLSSTAESSPATVTNLYIAWSMTPTNSGQLVDRVRFTIPGCSTVTDQDTWYAGQSTIAIALSSLGGQDACGVSYGRIDLAMSTIPALNELQGYTFPAYDVSVVLDLDVNANGSSSYSYMTNSSTFSNMYALGGSVLAGSEPSISTTQLVWSLGDLRTNGAGSIYYRLQGSCSLEGSERHRAYVRFNRRCEDGTTPQSATYSSTNTLATLFTPQVNAYIEPEVSYLEATTYVYRIEIQNSGAAVAHNLRAEIAKPVNIVFATSSLAVATSSTTNLVWTFQFADSPGDLVDADEDGLQDDLPPGGVVQVWVTNTITACTPNTIQLTASTGCKASTCQSTLDTASFFPSSPNLASTTSFPSNQTLCATGTVVMLVRNSGAGTAYGVAAQHFLPTGITYVAGTSRISIDGGTTNAIADPTGDGSTASPLTWTNTQISAFERMSPNQLVRIIYQVYAECDTAGMATRQFTARASYTDNCGYRFTNTPSVATMAVDEPLLTISKASRNVTQGQASFTSSTVPGNPGDVIAYRITIDHSAQSDAELLAMRLVDALPSSIAYVGAYPAPDSISGQTLTWSNTTLMALNGGAPYTRAESSMEIYVTGVVASCVANVQNVATVSYGCTPDTDCLTLSANSTVQHTFTPQLYPNAGLNDGLDLNQGGGTFTMTVSNSGGAATSMIITQAAPSGYVITGASVTGEFNSTSLNINLLGSPAGRTGIVSFTTAAASGATDLDDDLVDGLANLDLGYGNWFRITFTLIADGSTLDCAANPTDLDYADPDPTHPGSLSMQLKLGALDGCGQPLVTSASKSTYPLRPDPDIDIQPNSVIATNNEQVTFSVTLKNRGENGYASNLHARIKVGPGWTNLSVVSTSIIQSAAGTVLTEVQGNSNVLVSLPGVVLDAQDDQVVLGIRATAREGSGGLNIIAEIVGDTDNPSIPSICTPTNTLGEAPLANTMNGSVIGAVNGEYYGFDQDQSQVAGFSVSKTVRYAGDPAPGVTNLTARIGEDLIYRIEARFFGVTYSNAVITESLPANLVFRTPVDAGSTPNVSNLWVWNSTAGTFTLPTPLTTNTTFLVDIPVVVSNRAANQGESGSQTIFTNTATADFTASLVTNDAPVSATQVSLLEPVVQLTKTASTTAPVQAGHTIIYTNRIRQTATGLTNAYDIVFVDTLPAGLTFTGIDLGTDGIDNDADGVADGADAADEASLVSASTITVSTNNSTAMSLLATNGIIDIVFPVKVLNQLLGSTIVNTSRVTYTSLPGVATNLNERNGSGGINDYATSGTSSITSSPVTAVTKTRISTTQTNTVDPLVTIGERLLYRVRVDVPHGVVTNAVIRDIPPRGLDWVGPNANAGLAYPGYGYQFVIPAGGPQFPTTTVQGLVITDTDPSATSSTDNNGSGSNVVFTIGGITNAPDGDSGNDYFELFMEYVVLNEATNNGLNGLTLSNANRVTYSDTLTTLNATSEYHRIAEHDIRVIKSRTPSTLHDAGDVITFSLVVSNLNTATANAYDMVVQDAITNTVYDTNTITLVSPAPGWGYDVTNTAASAYVRFVSSNGVALAPGAKVTNIFSVALREDVRPNLRFTNRVDIFNADTIDGVTPGGITSRNDTANSTVVMTITNFRISKAVFETSETGPVDSTTTNVQIGEVVTYQLGVTLPESVITNLTITDVLPAGMAYVVGSASNDTSTFGGTLAALAVTPATGLLGGDGEDIVFTFSGATTTTADNATGNNSFNLYFKSVVLNTNVNVGLAGAQHVLTNIANITYLGNPSNALNSTTSRVNVIEPSLALFKNIIQTNADAGDTVDVTLVLTNSGLATAYDLEISDPLLPEHFDISTVTPVSVPNGYTLTATSGAVRIRSNESSGPATNSLEARESLTIQFRVDMSQGLPPNVNVTNTASVTAGDTIYGTNLYAQHRTLGASASDTISNGNFGLTKTITGTSETGVSDSTNHYVQVGEVVHYAIAVQLPEGTVTNLQVTDLVPDGMAFVLGSVSNDTSSFGGTLGTMGVSPSGSGLAASGADVTITYSGNTVVNDDNSAGNNTFTIHLRAVVADAAGVNGLSGNQTVLTNIATITYAGNPSSPVQSGPVTNVVIEPNVVIGKDMSPATGDAGDLVTVTLTVTNTGLATAFDVQIQDTLPGGLFDITTVENLATPAGFTFTATGTPDRTVSFASDVESQPATNSIEAGEVVTFQFRARLAQTVRPGQSITNEAIVTAADSIRGTPGQGVQRDDSGARSSDTLGVPAASIAKAFVGSSASGAVDTTTTNITIGESATYRLTVTLPESSITNLVVTDLIPDGMSYVTGSVAVGVAGFGGSLPGAPSVTTTGASGDDVLFTFSGVTVVSNDNNTANNSFTIDLALWMLDVASNDGLPSGVDGDGMTIQTNRATVTFNSASAVTSTPVHVQVVEPYVGITKSMSAPTGGQSTVTLTVTNRGLSTAFDLIVTDLFDSNVWDTTTIALAAPTGYIGAVSGAPGSALVTFQSNSNAAIALRSLEVGEAVVFTVTAEVLESFTGTMVNTATVTRATTLSGSDPRERDEPDVSATAVMGSSDIVAIKKGVDVNGLPLLMGEQILYTVTLTNAGGGTATGVVLRDPIPTNTTLVSGSVSNNGSAVEAGNPSLTINVGTLAPGQKSTVTFLVTVNNGLGASVSQIYNRATATWNEVAKTEVADNDPTGHDTTVNNGLDDASDNGSDPADDDPTILPLAQVDYTLNKVIVVPNNRAAFVNETVQFRISVTNRGGVAFTSVPLTDTYETNYLTFQSSVPAADDTVNDGSLSWANVGSLGSGASTSIVVNFVARNATPAARTNLAVASPVVPVGQPDPGVKTASAPYSVSSSTFAPVVAMSAQGEAGNVVVSWETASEIGTTGFRIHRRVPGDEAAFAPVAEEMTPALVNAAQGARYSIVDATAVVGQTYEYAVEEIEDNGATVWHEPFVVTVEAARKNGRATGASKVGASLRSLPSGIPAPPSAGAGSDAERLRIVVGKDGVYAVSAAQVAAGLGMTTGDAQAGIRDGMVEVRRQGSRVAGFAAADGSALYFRGESLDSNVGKQGAYWVAPGRNVRGATVDGGMPPAVLGQTFTDTVRAESNKIQVMSLVMDATQDYWAWEQIIGGQVNASSKTFSVRSDGVVGSAGNASLRVRLFGGSNADANPDHHAIVKVNGAAIGEIRWDGRTAVDQSLSFPATVLADGPNTVVVEGRRGPGVSVTLFYVNDFELAYPRAYTARGGILDCAAGGHDVVSVGGFGTTNILAIEKGRGEPDRLVTGVAVTQDGASYRASFRPSAPDADLVVFEPAGTIAAASPAGAAWSELASPTNKASHVIIAASGFENAAATLAAHRTARGLRSKVVAWQDVVDAFGHGDSSPAALQAFLAWAYEYWAEKPEYVVIAGDGTYDYANAMGLNDNLIPPALIATPHGLFSSDVPFGDVVGGDGLPDIMVGRLPARTATDLSNMVQRIIAYETTSPAAWTTNVLVLADNEDAGGAFQADSELVAGTMSGVGIEKVYLGATTLTNARARAISRIQGGARLVNYLGHGALDRMAQEGLLTSADVTSLTNGVRRPVVVAMTCVLGRFSVPGTQSLGEELLGGAQGGAIAVWSPVGLSAHSLAQRLNEGFTRAHFSRGEKVIGRAIRDAMGAYVEGGGDSYLLGIYNLLGDPALEMK